MLLSSILCVFYSCDQVPENIEQKTIQLLSPGQNSKMGESVLFLWKELDDADKYHFQLCYPSFDAAQGFILDTLLVKVDSLNQVGNKISIDSLAPGRYQWKVRGENFGYKTEYQIRSFVVQ